MASAAVPRGLPDRDEVIGNILLACAPGSKRTDIAKRPPEFIRAHNRDNDHFKTASLNECLPATDLAPIDKLPKLICLRDKGSDFNLPAG